MTENNLDLQRLLEKIYNDRGFDFREYRETTLARRLRRRLFAWKVDTYTAYATVLDMNPDEYEKLFNDLTINVSSFFRDDDVFKVLKETVLPALVNGNSNPLRTLRIWCAGCATGQEPYSIAILLHEIHGAEIGRRDIAILATDIDNKVLQRAREGEPANLVSVRDITERKKAEMELKKINIKLRDTLNHVRTLRGLVPICASCKKIRDDRGFWDEVETYVTKHSHAEFSHSICPNCMERLYPGQYKRLKEKGKIA